MRELKLSNHEQLFNISIIRSYDPTEFSKAFDKIDHNILIRKSCWGQCGWQSS